MTTHLIIDDSPTIRLTMRKVLEGLATEEIDVLEAVDGDSGVKKFKENEPDVVFLDIELGRKDGHAVLRELLAERPEARVVIVTSAERNDERVRDALGQGAFAIVQKPVRRDEIAKVLADLDHESRRTRRIQ